jgi:hypothetical protein
MNQKKYSEAFDPRKYQGYVLAKIRVRLLPYVLFVGLGVMVFSVIAGFLILILAGLGILLLPESILHIVATSTIGAVGSALLIVFKFFFGKE